MTTFKSSLSILIVALLMLAACSKSTGVKKSPQETITRVAVKPIQTNTLPEQMSYSGTIEADNTVSLGFSVPGRVEQVLAEEGQTVARGQLLASVETVDYASALAMANAGLVQAEDTYKRLDQLYRKGSLPEKDYIGAWAGLQQAKANREVAAKRLADTRLYAPFSGIIVAKNVEKGTTAAPGVPAFTVVKIDQVYARVAVPEVEIGQVSPGIAANVQIPTLHQEVSGNVSIINPQADPVTKTYTVKVLLHNPGGKLLPGMLADVQLQTGKTTQSLTIPPQAVVRDEDGVSYVFVASKENGQALRRRVRVGSLTGQEITVTEGLQNGDMVVVTGQNKLKDGQAIRIQ